MAYIPKTWRTGEVIEADDLNHLEQGVAGAGGGEQGIPGEGVPPGGAAGQFLAKRTAADYDTIWKDPPSGGGDGTGGDVDLSAYAPKENPVFTGTVSMESCDTRGENSVAFGLVSEATGDFSFAAGYSAKATAQGAHAEGNGKATNNYAHAEGYGEASGNASHAEGGSEAEGNYSHAEGTDCVAGGDYSHTGGRSCETRMLYGFAHGLNCVSSGTGSVAFGVRTIASSHSQFAIGRNNAEGNIYDMFIVGSGTDNVDGTIAARANCFRATTTGTYASGSYNASGADYAELFEWADGNPEAEDRAGRFATLDGAKIRLAGPEDGYVLGVVSGNPSVVGDVYDDQWQGMYLYDVFGRPVWEDVEIPEKTVEIPDPENPEKTIAETVIPAHTERRQKLNPAYDHTQPYVPRTQRPEWDAVGLVGKLVMVDDGTCVPDGFCGVGEGGIATASAERTKYRVMERLDENHIRVMIL